MATAIMDGLFQDVTAVSGSRSAEESCTKHLCLPGITLNPFTLEKGDAPGWISLLLGDAYTKLSVCTRILMI